jgi:hypothetical protein
VDTPLIGQAIPSSPTYIGGVRFTKIPFDFGWPAARLVVCEQGVWIGPSALIFRLFIPAKQFRFDDSDIQSIGRTSLNAGIRFHSRETGRWVIFWSWGRRRGEILKELQSLTGGVSAKPIPLNFFRPGP